ncbi:hypothetical protein ACOMHN_044981 [Nucella lapillus]
MVRRSILSGGVVMGRVKRQEWVYFPPGLRGMRRGDHACGGELAVRVEAKPCLVEERACFLDLCGVSVCGKHQVGTRVSRGLAKRRDPRALALYLTGAGPWPDLPSFHLSPVLPTHWCPTPQPDTHWY